MFSNIFLFKRKKYLYSNRLYTLKNTLTDLQDQSSSYVQFDNINFEDTNGITCTLTINVDYDKADDSYMYFNYCYNQTYNTRWFITACNKPREAQYVYTLVRDVFVDYYDDIVASSAIIKRANQITPTTSLAQYKKTTNLSQIKKGEVVLEDGAGKGWIYVYLAKNAQLTGNYLYVPKTQNAWNNSITLTTQMISDLTSKPLLVMTDMEAYFKFYRGELLSNRVVYWQYTCNASNITKEQASGEISYTSYFTGVEYVQNAIRTYITKNYNDYLEHCKANGGYVINDQYSALAGLNGQVVADTNNKLYTVNVTEVPSPNGKYFVAGTDEQNKAIANSFGWSSKNGNPLNFNLIGKAYQISFTKVKNVGTYYYGIQSSLINNRTTTTGCLYDVMAFPLECPIQTKNYKSDETSTNVSITTSYAETMNFIQALKQAMGDSIYDIQWLPYGPFEADTQTSGTKGYDLTTKQGKTSKTATFTNSTYTTTETTTEGDVTTTEVITSSKTSYNSEGTQIDTSVAGQEGSTCANVAWINLASNNCHRSVIKELVSETTNLLENRIENETTFYRLCGPNWNSTFEFSSALNGGLKGYYIDMTLKPYNPFVRVQPMFSKMYGNNFNDPRGLILKGDFSIEQTSDAYKNYQLNNRNYDLIFNRQMQSLDLKNSVAQQQDSLNKGMDILGVFTGGISGATSGATTGAMTGNALAVAGGAVAGAVTGVVGGVADLAINNQLRDMNKALRFDSRQASISQYQYQLGNVVALPNTLTRSSSFDNMYRVYPVLEIYSCSDEEKYQLEQSIEWNGIEINQISTLKEQISYQKSELYIQAEILRYNGDVNDQIYATISELLANGIYIERS